MLIRPRLLYKTGLLGSVIDANASGFTPDCKNCQQFERIAVVVETFFDCKVTKHQVCLHWNLQF